MLRVLHIGASIGVPREYETEPATVLRAGTGEVYSHLTTVRTENS